MIWLSKKAASSGITKNVLGISLVSFFNDIASEMIYPIVPIFLTTVLGAPVTIVGLIEGIAESTASILRVFSGWFSDRFQKRKPFMIAGYVLSSLSKLIMAVSVHWSMIMGGRFLDRFGKGVRTSARDALLAEGCDASCRGRVFGFHRVIDNTEEEAHSIMKEDLAGGKLPSSDFGENAAWWWIMILSLNLNMAMKHLVLKESWSAKRMKALCFLPHQPAGTDHGGGTTTGDPHYPGAPFADGPYRGTAKNHGAWLCVTRLTTKELRTIRYFLHSWERCVQNCP
jgi:hypothetical protein